MIRRISLYRIPLGVEFEFYTRQDLSETEAKVTYGEIYLRPEVGTRSYHLTPSRYYVNTYAFIN